MATKDYKGTMTPEDYIHSPGYGRITVAEAAEKAAGAWANQDSFVWWADSDYAYPEDWMHYCIETGQSGLIEQSNAATMRRWFEEGGYIADGSVVEEHHSHWAAGGIEMLIIRVYDRVMEDGSPLPEDWEPGEYDRYYTKRSESDGTRRGPISAAFLFLCQIMDDIDNYPVLDEDDYSMRQYQAGLWNIKDALWYLTNAYGDAVAEDNLPPDWDVQVSGLFSEQEDYDIVDGDEYPSEEKMFEAFLALGYINPEYLTQEQRREYEINKRAKEIAESDDFTQRSFIQGMTALDLARAELANVIWEQKEID